MLAAELPDAPALVVVDGPVVVHHVLAAELPDAPPLVVVDGPVVVHHVLLPLTSRHQVPYIKERYF